MTGRDLADLLDEHGYDFFTGVPCSLVAVREDKALLAELETRAAARGRSPYVPSDGVAAAAGSTRAVCVTTSLGISEALTEALASEGPSFLLARVTAEDKPAPRIPYPPEEIRDRFRRALGGSP
jgi:hypothetical protein